MSSRQHTPLILTMPGGASRSLAPVSLQSTGNGGGYDEDWVRNLVFDHPAAVPVQEIDPSFGPLIPICRELQLEGAGYADALMLNPLGMPTLVECKLWRNPEARRKVVAQILDYARVLRTWTFSDLQREAAKARRERGFDLFAHVRDSAGLPDLDPAAFADNVSRHLSRSRVLLLVLGDGIREGVEAIVDYIQGSVGQHFTFGLVEAQIYELDDGRRIVQPRVLARTLIVNRTIVETTGPQGRVIDQDEASEERAPAVPAPAAAAASAPDNAMKAFWTDMLAGLRLDDAEQPLANALPRSNITFSLAKRSGTWLTAFFWQREHRIGVFLGSDRTSDVAREIWKRLDADRAAIESEIIVPTIWEWTEEGKLQIGAAKLYDDLFDLAVRDGQIAWFRLVVNSFVNALRPRVAAIMRDLAQGASLA